MAERGGQRHRYNGTAVTLESLRQRIDELDEQIVRLLNERARCALQIGQTKKTMELPMYQPEREAEVLRRVRAASVAGGGPLGPEAIARLFERIIDEARGLELKAVR
jgi:chorismate mutase